MAKQYLAGAYYIQWRGRGPINVRLTKAQAKALFELSEKIPHELQGIEYIHG